MQTSNTQRKPRPAPKVPRGEFPPGGLLGPAKAGPRLFQNLITTREHAAHRDRLLSVADAADQLQVSSKSVRRAIQRGDLSTHRIGRLLRISTADLAAFIAQRRCGSDDQ